MATPVAIPAAETGVVVEETSSPVMAVPASIDASLAGVYRWMVASIGEAMSQARPMQTRVALPLDTIESLAAEVPLGRTLDSAETRTLWRHLWIAAHTRHFHSVVVLAWARLQKKEACYPDECSKMIVGLSEVRWKQTREEIAAYEDGDPHKKQFLSLSAAEYIDRALAANHTTLFESPAVTPFINGQSPAGVTDAEFRFKPAYLSKMREVYKYTLRIYAHLYLHHNELLPQIFGNFLAPPRVTGNGEPVDTTGAAPTDGSDKFAFHFAYVLHFGLTYDLVTRDQVDALGKALTNYIWSLPEMEHVQVAPMPHSGSMPTSPVTPSGTAGLTSPMPLSRAQLEEQRLLEVERERQRLARQAEKEEAESRRALEAVHKKQEAERLAREREAKAEKEKAVAAEKEKAAAAVAAEDARVELLRQQQQAEAMRAAWQTEEAERRTREERAEKERREQEQAMARKAAQLEAERKAKEEAEKAQVQKKDYAAAAAELRRKNDETAAAQATIRRQQEEERIRAAQQAEQLVAQARAKEQRAVEEERVRVEAEQAAKAKAAAIAAEKEKEKAAVAKAAADAKAAAEREAAAAAAARDAELTRQMAALDDDEDDDDDYGVEDQEENDDEQKQPSLKPMAIAVPEPSTRVHTPASMFSPTPLSPADVKTPVSPSSQMSTASAFSEVHARALQQRLRDEHEAFLRHQVLLEETRQQLEEQRRREQDQMRRQQEREAEYARLAADQREVLAKMHADQAALLRSHREEQARAEQLRAEERARLEQARAEERERLEQQRAEERAILLRFFETQQAKASSELQGQASAQLAALQQEQARQQAELAATQAASRRQQSMAEEQILRLQAEVERLRIEALNAQTSAAHAQTAAAQAQAQAHAKAQQQLATAQDASAAHRFVHAKMATSPVPQSQTKSRAQAQTYGAPAHAQRAASPSRTATSVSSAATRPTSSAPSAVSPVDPLLIAPVRAELLARGSPPMIAHNLAEARVDQLLRTGRLPGPGYVPSAGYGKNGRVLLASPMEEKTPEPVDHFAHIAPSKATPKASSRVLQASSRQQRQQQAVREREELEHKYDDAKSPEVSTIGFRSTSGMETSTIRATFESSTTRLAATTTEDEESESDTESSDENEEDDEEEEEDEDDAKQNSVPASALLGIARNQPAVAAEKPTKKASFKAPAPVAAPATKKATKKQKSATSGETSSEDADRLPQKPIREPSPPKRDPSSCSSRMCF